MTNQQVLLILFYAYLMSRQCQGQSCGNNKFQETNGCNGKCDPTCSSCDNATSCLTCTSGQNPISGFCCATGCGSCTLTNPCTSCTSGYFASGESCLPCVSPCTICSTQNNCSACISGYYVSGSACLPCVNPCTVCTTALICSSCVSGYFISGSSCQICQKPCATCSGTSTSCTSCVEPSKQQMPSCNCTSLIQYINSLNNYICSNCVSPCVTCSGQNICNSCIDTYYLSNTLCQLCQKPCLNCITSSNNCTSCMDSTNQTTSACNCPSGFIMNQSSYLCQQCTAPCATCQNQVTECLSCISNYTYDSSNHTCACLETQYFQTGATNICQNCQSPCFGCVTNATTCQSCILGYLSGSSCICNNGYYDNSGTCQQCTLPCIYCVSATECQTCNDSSKQLLTDCRCQDNFYMDSSSFCQSCVSPCQKCVDQTQCSTCITGYTLSGTTCSNSNSNPTCGSGQFLNLSSICQVCTHPCSECETNSTNCTSCYATFISDGFDGCTCQQRYYEDIGLNPSQCIICVAPCAYCTSVNDCSTCVGPNQRLDNQRCLCNDGFYMNGTTCSPCVAPCAYCTSVNDCSTCVNFDQTISGSRCVCKDGFYLNSVGSCIICQSPCKLCNGSQDYCVSCIDRYYLDNHICKKCHFSCNKCNSLNFCTECSNSYTLIGNQCICTDGYYESQEQCYKCNFPCSKCSNKQICLECQTISFLSLNLEQSCECQDGYFWSANSCQQCCPKCRTCKDNENYCLECNTSLNRILINNTCECDKNYFENNLNECQSCNSDAGKIIEKCQYKDCSDGIWTYGEECDDGNSLSRDGCTNCKIDDTFVCKNSILQPSLCQSCQANCQECQEVQSTQMVCQKCKSGYFLLNQQCIQCNERCFECEQDSFNCIQCKFIKNKNDKCLLCEEKEGYYTDKLNLSCYTKCGDTILADIEECDDGNNINGDGCNSKCFIEKLYQCKQNVCIVPTLPTPNLEILENPTVYNPIRKFQMKYNVPLSLSDDFNFPDNLQLMIEKKFLQSKSIYYTYNISLNLTKTNQHIENYKEVQILFTLSLNQTSQDEYFVIQFKDPSLIKSYEGYEQQIFSLSAVIQSFIYVNQDSKEKVETINSKNNNLMYIFLIIAATLFLFGGLEIIFNLLDTIQLLSYLQYINIEYPYNLQEFFNFFGFVQLNFISEYFNLESLTDPYVHYENLKPLPQKIADDGYKSLFIINGTAITTVWFSLFSVYFLAKITPQLLKKLKLKYYIDNPQDEGIRQKIKLIILQIKIFIHEICNYVVDEFFYSGILRTHMATSYDFSFYVILQLYAFDLDSSDILVQISSLFSLICLFTYLTIIFIATQVLQKKQYNFQILSLKQSYGSLFEGLKLRGFTRYFSVFQLIRKFLFMTILVKFYQNALFQAGNLLLLSVLSSLFLLIFRPLSDIFEYPKQIICEINISLTLLAVVVLVANNEIKIFEKVNEELIGWLCITLISIILLIQLLIDLFQQWRMLYNKYKNIQKILQKLTQLFRKKQNVQAPHNIFEQLENPNSTIILFE